MIKYTIYFIVIISVISCADHLEPEPYINPQSKDPLSVHYFDKPQNRYTNQDSIRFIGWIEGYTNIICEGGAEKIKDVMMRSAFDITVPLKKNQLNQLLFYAMDEYERFSDSVYIKIIHDNIPPKLVSTSLPENGVSVNANKSFEFYYDSPVIPHYSRLELDNIDGHMTPILKNNNATIEFTGHILSVGREYPFHVIVTDSADNRSDTTITFKTFYKYILYDDVIETPELSSDGNYMFVQEKNTRSLKKYDINNSWTLVGEYNMSISGRLSYNPYNNNLYISSADESKIIEVDPETGTEIREIRLVKTGNEVYTPDDPASLAFTGNGIGVATARPVNSSGPYSVQIIDSRFNDSVYVHPRFAPEVSYDYFACTFNNYNNIFLANYNPRIQIYHPDINDFVQADNISSTCIRFAGHKKADRFMIYGNGGAYLQNSEGEVLGNISNFRSRSFDFTYETGEEDKLYYIYIFDSEIGVLDFNQLTKEKKAWYFSDSNGMIVTLDGKYVISYLFAELLIIEPKSFLDN